MTKISRPQERFYRLSYVNKLLSTIFHQQNVLFPLVNLKIMGVCVYSFIFFFQRHTEKRTPIHMFISQMPGTVGISHGRSWGL